MSVPSSVLNSIDRIANELEKVEIQAVNQQTVVPEASETIGSLRSKQSAHLKSRPSSRAQSVSTFSPQGEATGECQNKLSGPFIDR
jgi:hypothetical protein